MRFGKILAKDAVGAILAHSINKNGIRWKKGRVLTTSDITSLAAIEIDSVIVAQLEHGDIGEDAAATEIATLLDGVGVFASEAFTGRVNLIARFDGLIKFDRKIIETLNLVDESITVATTSNYERATKNQIVATIKIIPFAVHENIMRKCKAVLSETKSAIDVKPFKTKRVALIQTTLGEMKESILVKTTNVMRSRVETLGFELVDDLRIPHNVTEVASALSSSLNKKIDICLVAGASAITDRRDIVPAGISEAGGKIIHLGMPVDPGNLLLLGSVGKMVTIGLPGCARSPKFNGIDLILNRLAADISVGARDIMLLGVGGLLNDYAGRPMPRSNNARKYKHEPKIAGLVLAAGQSRRMGSINKLLAEISGESMIRRTVTSLVSSLATPVIAITGHQSEKVLAKINDLAVDTVYNPAYRNGLSTSLHKGLAALPSDIDGVLVCLGDMPQVSSTIINQLIEAFNPEEGNEICIPTWRGKRGNPVLLSSRFFPEVNKIDGDVGARELLARYPEFILEVEVASNSVLVDIDTPQSLERAQCR
tara:strand:- start:1555 stop:3171 length:1617 start_codon:yes stop_codon:yes gene_type:complete